MSKDFCSCDIFFLNFYVAFYFVYVIIYIRICFYDSFFYGSRLSLRLLAQS